MRTSIKDEPNTQRAYETIFILRPNATHDGIALVNSRVRTAIEQLGGKVLELKNWGKRKLGYEVKKELKGIYLFWKYLGTAGMVQEIERNLRLQESVIRFYTIKVDYNIDPASMNAIEEEAYVKAASTVPDEEELVTGTVRFHAEDLEDDMGLDSEFSTFDDQGRVL